ncbi:MAG TPA: GNAT family N-acetyltransferase [Burkholderiaceae bacterium]|nr:GNAT family N-acetyltransferase [Burkholderiaceae bacterium]
MLLIRQLDPADSLAHLTSLLHRAYAHLAAMGLNYTAVDQTAETTARRIEGGHCLVAEYGGELAGTVLAKPTDAASECEYFTRDSVATLRQFAVEPRLQGRGIGLALIRACEAWAREHGFGELALDTAEPATHLVRLYSRLGFSAVGHVQWPGKVYRSVVMSKTLR